MLISLTDSRSQDTISQDTVARCSSNFAIQAHATSPPSNRSGTYHVTTPSASQCCHARYTADAKLSLATIPFRPHRRAVLSNDLCGCFYGSVLLHSGNRPAGGVYRPYDKLLGYSVRRVCGDSGNFRSPAGCMGHKTHGDTREDHHWRLNPVCCR